MVIERYNSMSFWWLFALSVPCGLLVYLGVTAGRENIVLLILCVIAFVIGGFPHCIAT
jgi:formate/nitrite transporter FocA (FNT family)